jgi:hypothetical protein
VGNSPQVVNSDLITDNLFTTPVSPNLDIVNCDGINVSQNTFYTDNVTVISLTDSGDPGVACIVQNNSILASGKQSTGIRVRQFNFSTRVSIANNMINTNGGVGLSFACAAGSDMVAFVEGNDFHGNRIGVSIVGDGNSAGSIDLGGDVSLGRNDFRDFNSIGTLFSAAITLTQTSPTTVIPAAGNIFRPGTSPAAVVDDSVEGSMDGTGQINAGAKLDDPHAFVQTLYNDLLGRNGTSSELDGWASLFSSQGQPAVVNGILHSSEALGRIVDQYYLRFLGRQSDPGGRAGWISFLQSGGTEENLETAFLTSREYISHIDTDFVQSLYINILGRTGSTLELAGWNNNIQSLGLAGIASAFTHSAENRANTITSYFQTFLHRPPTNSELAAEVGSPQDLLSVEGALLSTPEFFANG